MGLGGGGGTILDGAPPPPNPTWWGCGHIGWLVLEVSRAVITWSGENDRKEVQNLF